MCEVEVHLAAGPQLKEFILLYRIGHSYFEQAGAKNVPVFSSSPNALPTCLFVYRTQIEAAEMSKDEQRMIDLIRRFQDKYDRRKYAIQALIKIGPSVVSATVQELASNDLFVKSAAATVLGGIKDARALDALIDALKDNRQRVRYAVANALADIGDPKVISMLQETVKEEETWDIHPSMEALKKLGAFPKPQPPPARTVS